MHRIEKVACNGDCLRFSYALLFGYIISHKSQTPDIMKGSLSEGR